ncbi:uncharacterized protein [Spinacia oleracea]|uniref:Integrase catalytic domain-containing protein n=1 Tax=Spinacia oleracea TaxID=3562 RepID=A0ABM3QU67_SPIOL|nr:uncharacterized protein LOC130462525 [Spinacia oleracea]
MTRPTQMKNDKTQWIIYVGGSATQNGCGAGIICESPEGDIYEYAMCFKFQVSNNEAEYEALICGIQMSKAAGAEEILALSDSQLIVSQVNGEYEAKDDAMIKYLEIVRQEIQPLTSFEVQRIPRAENNKEDALSKFASSASCDTPRHVFWEVKQSKSIDVIKTAVLDRTPTWMDDIVNYKMNGILPEDPKQAEKLQKKCSWFEMWNGTLYKKVFSRPLLRCVTPGSFGRPTSRVMQLSHRRKGFGRKISKDWLTPITSPIPFAEWGMDLLGPYTMAPGGVRYVIVVVDYFTKWVEAEALKNAKAQDVRAFIWKNIITRLGVPQSIVFDNGPQFKTPKLEGWLADHGITTYFTSVDCPQANGQVEAFNKTISEGMKKKLDEAKGLWADELPNVFW